MGDTSDDPIDHARTTRKHAGETMKNSANAPGLAAVALGVVAFVIGLFAFASGNPTHGTVALVFAAIVAATGGVWLFVAHRRVRRRELRQAAREPDADAPPPTS
jgi:uncharacterized membrane protein HdeD (DUF308 family)